MRIAQIANPYLPVPPIGYGSVERVVDVLARGLQEQGHDVTLFATSDSTCPVPRHPDLMTSHPDRAMHVYVEIPYIYEVYKHLDEFDVVHDHTMVGPLHATSFEHAYPVVTTCHERFEYLTTPIYREQARTTALITLSEFHAQAAPVPTQVIPSGLDLMDYPYGGGDGGYLLFMGRMVPEKGPHIAAAIARKAGVPLRIAARISAPEEIEFFEQVMKPLLGAGIEFIGEVGGRERLELFQNASALLLPLLWDEPFGLVMIEALACGTPVITYPRGSAAEIVEHDRNGFLCFSEAEMVEACQTIGERISRAVCRDDAEARFSMQRMARDHVQLYQQLIQKNERTRGATR